MQIPKWNITELNGYVPQTTFWLDFSIADKFGLEAVIDTYKRSLRDFRTNLIYFTELILVVNHKCWEHYHRSEPKSSLKPFLTTEQHKELSKFYSNTYYQLLDIADDTYKDDDLNYLYNVID